MIMFIALYLALGLATTAIIIIFMSIVDFQGVKFWLEDPMALCEIISMVLTWPIRIVHFISNALDECEDLEIEL